MNKHLVKSILVALVFLFFSCEYETDKDHFVEKEKPAENVDLKLNIKDVGEDGIIYIYTSTQLTYFIDAPSQQLLNVKFAIDGQDIRTYNNTLVLYPISNEEKEQDLKVKVEIKSNTGSLSDKLYLEKYIGEFSFKVRYVKTELKLNITQETTSEGYLKLVWDKPSLKQTSVAKYNISYYDIISRQEKSFDIEDPDNCFFIDEDYVYGHREYKITTYFENGKIQPWKDLHKAHYEKLTVEDLQLNLRQQISSDGYLELVWDKPVINRMPVIKYLIEYYDVQSGGWQTRNIDVDKTSFVDENYAYGDREYRFTVWLYDELFGFNTKFTPVYKKLNEDDFVFEDIGQHTIRISWPQPEFKCTKILRLFDNKNILVSDEANSVEVDRLPFPYLSWRFTGYKMIDLHILGKKTGYDLVRHPNFYSQGNVGTNYHYDYFKIKDDFLRFVAYPKSNRLYTLARRGIYSTDMKTMKVTQHLSFDETISISMSCDPYSSRVAIRDYNRIDIYKDHNFTNPIRIKLAYGVHPAYGILNFTSDNKLLVASNMSGSNFYNISLMAYDADTGEYLYDIPIPHLGKHISAMRLSGDNKYMLLSLYKVNDESSMQTDILELNGNQTTLVKSFSYNDLMSGGSSVSLYSSNPTRIIQGSNSKFQISELPSFNKIVEIEGELSSVDVVNGNFLYTTTPGGLYRNLNIIDPTFSKILFQTSVDTQSNLLSFNNILVSSHMHAWGTYWDISKFMEK